MTDLLQITGVQRRFTGSRSPLDILRGRPAPELVAVSGVSLDVAQGEVLGIVGESGCGKSTLARLAVGLQPADAGTVHLLGSQMHGPDAAGRIQMVFQDPYSSLNPRMSIGALLSETLRRYRPELDATARKAEVLAVLDRVGLPPETAGRYPHHLSGGQQQRVSIARALAPRPRLLVADEPVSALDASVQAQIINLLQRLVAEDGISIIFISHDMQVVRHICHRVAVMYLGEVVEVQSADALFLNPMHPYTRALIAAVPNVNRRRTAKGPPLKGEMPDPFARIIGCRFHPRCPFAEPACQSAQALRQMGPDAAVRCWKAPIEKD
ncbi:MAG: ABC transporter ATP-binding protein [Paracoccaceae bacterium]